MADSSYNRQLFMETLIYHRPNEDSSCMCGWRELGMLHSGHVADVYEQRSPHVHIIELSASRIKCIRTCPGDIDTHVDEYRARDVQGG